MHTPDSHAAEQADLALHALRGQLWARAHHEAAHAVVGTLLGGRVTGAAIWPGPPVSGRVVLTGLHEGPDAGTAPDQFVLVRRIVYLLAGPIAEQIAGGMGMIANEPASRVAAMLLEGVRDQTALGQSNEDRPREGQPTDGLPPDVLTVVGLLLDHFGPDGEAELAAAVDHLPLHVENLLRERWRAVEMILASLLRHGRLTDDQFRALFAEALPGAEMTALLDPSSA
jgi:hypothetical protein